MPKERRENIKLLIGLFGQQLGIALKAKDNKNIEDASFEVVPPPELGVSDN